MTQNQIQLITDITQKIDQRIKEIKARYAGGNQTTEQLEKIKQDLLLEENIDYADWFIRINKLVLDDHELSYLSHSPESRTYKLINYIKEKFKDQLLAEIAKTEDQELRKPEIDTFSDSTATLNILAETIQNETPGPILPIIDQETTHKLADLEAAEKEALPQTRFSDDSSEKTSNSNSISDALSLPDVTKIATTVHDTGQDHSLVINNNLVTTKTDAMLKGSADVVTEKPEGTFLQPIFVEPMHVNNQPTQQNTNDVHRVIEELNKQINLIESENKWWMPEFIFKKSYKVKELIFLKININHLINDSLNSEKVSKRDEYKKLIGKAVADKKLISGFFKHRTRDLLNDIKMNKLIDDDEDSYKRKISINK